MFFTKFSTMIVLLCIGLTTSTHAQFRWAAGGPNADESHSVIQTPDGGFAVAGNTQSYGVPGKNGYVLKFNSAGVLQWSKSIGGVNTDNFYTIIATADGGYALTGWTLSYGAGNNDMFVVKLDGSGNVQWTRAIGGTGDDYGCSLVQTADGGYVIAGHSESFGTGNADIFIVKLSSGGALQWSRTAGGTNVDYAYSIIKTADGGFATVGSTMSYGQGSYDMYIMKLNSNGIVEWSRTIGGADHDTGLSIIQSSDGSYVMTGHTYSFGGGNYDMYIVKINGSGALSWARTLGGSNYEFASSVVQVADGGYIVAGCTESFGSGGADFYVAKLNSSGTVQWQKTAGGANDEYGFTVVQTTDGGYSVTGYTESFGAGSSDIFLVKFSANGNTCGSNTSPSGSSGSGGIVVSLLPPSLPRTPTVTSLTPVIVSGGSVTTLCLTGIELTSNEIPSSFQLSQNYPNPFNPVTNIKFSIPQNTLVTLKVYDVSGREVAELINKNMPAGSYTVDYDASALPSGAYFYKMTSGDFTETKKMILIK